MQDFTRLKVGNKTHRLSVDGYESGAALPREKTDGLRVRRAGHRSIGATLPKTAGGPSFTAREVTWWELRADGGGSRLVAATPFVLASKPLLAPSREHWQKV